MPIQHTQFIWVDGELQPWQAAVVPVVTHALHYGTSVFEGVRVYPTTNGAAIFRLRDHVERLLYSAQTLGMMVPYTVPQLIEAAVALVRANKLTHGYVRPVVTYGEDHMSLLTDARTPVHVYFVCWPWPALLGEKPLRVTVSSRRRIPPTSCDPKAKVGGLYVVSSVATSEAHQRGYDEALMLDQVGNIAEGPGENIFFVRGKEVFTPAVGSLLPGITRATVMTLCHDLGLSVQEVQWTPKQLAMVDEAFFTGTAAEVAPIAEIDEYQFRHAFGPVTRQLRTQYLDIVHARQVVDQTWLTNVTIN